MTEPVWEFYGQVFRDAKKEDAPCFVKSLLPELERMNQLTCKACGGHGHTKRHCPTKVKLS